VNKYPICTYNGKTYCKTKGIFRENEWYCHYECALSCIEGECYEQALKCLKNTEKLKRDNIDQRMVKTYGMHFVDYFLHRERGIIFFKTGKYELALQELSLSVDQEPSERAYHYLDLTRSEIIKQKKIATTIPQIVLFHHSDSSLHLSNNKKIVISGKVTDEQYVSGVFINQKPIFIKKSNQSILFSKELILSEGKHLVEIKAFNILKKKSIKRINFLIDRSGPVVEIQKITANRVEGFISDSSGEIVFHINNNPAQTYKKKTSYFSIPFDQHTKILKFVAEDKLGNQTNGNISLMDNSLTASNGQTISDTSPLICRKQLTPRLDLSHINTNHVVVYKDIIELKGFVDYHKLIQSLVINKKLINKNPAIRIDFSQSIHLKEGMNKIPVSIQYGLNKSISKILNVERKIQKVRQVAQRRSIYIRKVDNENANAFVFSQLLIKKIIKTKRFNVRLNSDYSHSNNDLIIIGIPLIQSYNSSLDQSEKELESAIIIQDSKGNIKNLIDAYCDILNKGTLFQLDFLAERIVENIISKYPLIDGTINKNIDKLLIATPDQIKPHQVFVKFNHQELALNKIIQQGDNIIVYKETSPDSPFGSETKIIGFSSVKGLYLYQYSIKNIQLSNDFRNIRGINR
jgi:tetratricopeptide (TPR) repeat protein